MCGIAGLVSRNGAPPAREVLDRLAGALGHRGPDGHGFHVDGATALVHTRLAIIDLETGDQPFRSGGVTLVANGEVYNYLELRDALPDTDFATHSDCEVPLHLYRRDGLDYAGALRGMYAIAIHDGDRLVLTRDPFGIKPLYWCESAAHFAFASEPAALVAAGLVEPALRGPARDQLLQLQFTCGAETAFQGIHRVLPGETLVVEHGRVVERRRRPALSDRGPERLSEAEALERLDQVLRDSVTLHQRSDVPYGMFLSGGVDSSAVLALMRDLNDEPVRAFTAGFSGTRVHDERAHAEAVAKAAGAHFQAVDFGEEDFWRLLPAIAGAIDDPAADYAVLPSFKLAEKARAEGLKVVLSGEGGDELFAGYGRYRKAGRPKLMGGRPMRAKGAFDGLGVLRDETKGWRDGIAAAEAAEARGTRNRLQVAQAVDCADWLPHDLLIKLDRCLMAFGVEGRTPFLDPEVAKLAYRLPDRLKVRGKTGKWLLRQWLSKALPESEPFAKKRGFTVPVEEWIRARGKDLGPLVAAQPGVAEACRPGAVETLFATTERKAGQAAWRLLYFALWHRHHILGLASTGNVFETLAAS